MLESLLNLCPQVRRFGVRGAVADAEATSLEEELLSKLPPLVELRFAPGKTFDQLLSQIPTLKHLELFEARGKPSKAGKKSSPYPSKLVSLAIETGAPLPPLLLVLRSSSSTLHHLSLDTHTLAKLATEITNLPNLDHLSLLIIRRDKRTSVDILDEIFDVLVDCSTLRTLDLACDEYIDFYPSDIDRFPSRLHAIRLALWFKDETLQKLLNDGNRRDLRHVVVGKNEMREELVVLARKAGWEAYRGAEGVRFSR
ncbi:hypothetical protein BCR35DRAFT_305084 [Leucosporidium creatinivorum]|uniref:F-box domain-containing protein n=1 Tax=Leucosporidium creatinivorum TaxID=106004 RepID=A0A1Y2F3J7_9BASI|nr:hypothetical protein BCR35DRAFT_305084 [Leucosporidium creatinivorum]